jgi:hypothetical protein
VAAASTAGSADSADLLGSPNNTSKDGFITVSKKKRGNPRSVISDDNVKSVRQPKIPMISVRTTSILPVVSIPMISVRTTSILPVVSKRVKTKALFVSQFSP